MFHIEYRKLSEKMLLIRARESRMKQLVRISFFGPTPRVLPPPGVRFYVDDGKPK